ncbi:hypothetical protein [Actinomadura luteofluorescens]
MGRKFTRKFDPESPRDLVAEEYDAHQPSPSMPIPRVARGWVLLLPGGKPLSLYHQRHDCAALLADARLSEQCGENHGIQRVKVDEIGARPDCVACLLCIEETDYSKFKSCAVDTGTDRLQGTRLVWRADPAAGWSAVVIYKLRNRLVADIRTAGELKELSDS